MSWITLSKTDATGNVLNEGIDIISEQICFIEKISVVSGSDPRKVSQEEIRNFSAISFTNGQTRWVKESAAEIRAKEFLAKYPK